MPSKILDGKDAVIVQLAMQKKGALDAQAQSLVATAQQQFASDTALVVADLNLPIASQSVHFHVDRGTVTVEWPDEVSDL